MDHHRRSDRLSARAKLTITVSPRLLRAIDRVAERDGMARERAIEALLRCGAEVLSPRGQRAIDAGIEIIRTMRARNAAIDVRAQKSRSSQSGEKSHE